MRALWSNSKLQMVLALGLVAVTSLVLNPGWERFLTILLAVGITVGIDLALVVIRRVRLFLPSAAIVTGLIIGLIYQPQADLLELLLVCGVAMSSKNFLRVGRHLLNPAGLGVLLGGLILAKDPSWWGASFYQFPELTFFILLIPGIVSMYLMGRFKIVLSFLAGYLVLFSLLTAHFSPLTILDPTVLFFATVMLPEPQTSPHSPKNQLLFGGVVALGVSLISLLKIPLDSLVLSLLIGNLIFFKLR